jgi:predicted ATPase with chaperone activity
MMTMVEIPAPQTLLDTGIPRSLLEDLALKTLYVRGELLLSTLSEEMKLSLAIIDELFQRLRRDQFCEVKGMAGGIHRITTTSMGKARALELLSLNQYVGPAPVSLREYVRRVREQSVRQVDVGPPDIRQAFAHLVLNEVTLDQLGTAVVSGSSIFLYGPTGTGKTSIAETLPKIYKDNVLIPYAIEVDSQIIGVYDNVVHEKTVYQPDPHKFDGRWVHCRRPKVISGGELTIEMLDLQYNPLTKFYTAPMQVKANNGVLIIDDFGRQRVQPADLLNRWIVPLDRKIDFITLVGGKKFEVPFDLFVVFSTNLDPASLADDAFMRRIHNKIKVENVTREQFQEIFARVCRAEEVNYDPPVVEHLMDVITQDLKEPLRPCYPRDIVLQICWGARYEGKRPELNEGTIEAACRNYFLSTEA